MNCDLCNKTISAAEVVRIPLREMQQEVRKGFNPFKTAGIDLSLTTGLGGVFGMSGDDMYRDWRQRVLSDTTDWGLCPDCARAFRNATR